MKRERRLLVGIILLIALLGIMALPVLAQEESRNLTSSNFVIIRVYDSPYGFKVVYRQRDLSEQIIYVPTSWIYKEKIALLNYTKTDSAPYMQLFYDVDSGEFAFLRLVLPRSPEHLAWSFSREENLKEQFANASTSIF